MNFVGLTGRITKDPELKQAGNTQCVNFTLAVNKDFKDKNGNRLVDFINCVVYAQGAEFMNQYVKKGDMLAVVGKLNTRTYENQNKQKVYITEVIADKVEIAAKNNTNTNNNTENFEVQQDDIDYLNHIING